MQTLIHLLLSWKVIIVSVNGDMMMFCLGDATYYSLIIYCSPGGLPVDLLVHLLILCRDILPVPYFSSDFTFDRDATIDVRDILILCMYS